MGASLYCGIDVAAARGSHLCVLEPNGAGWAASFYERGDRSSVVRTVCALRPAAVAIDAPQALRRNLLVGDNGPLRGELGLPAGRYTGSRVCDALLYMRRLFLYQVPDEADAAPPWMRVGFEFFAELERAGYARLQPKVDRRGVGSGVLPGAGPWVFETYPDACFCSLCEKRPPKKSTVAGTQARVEALRQAGVEDHDLERRTHDELDACVAALTAGRAANGEACWLGHPDEGVIVLPVSSTHLKETYAPAPQAEPLRKPLREG